MDESKGRFETVRLPSTARRVDANPTTRTRDVERGHRHARTDVFNLKILTTSDEQFALSLSHGAQRFPEENSATF